VSVGIIAAWLIGTRVGRYTLLIVGAVIALMLAYLWIHHAAYTAGAASATAAAAVEALRRTAAAQKARREVKPNDQGAIDADPVNRDHR